MKTERTGRELCLFLIVMYRIQGKKTTANPAKYDCLFSKSRHPFLKETVLHITDIREKNVY